uniref:Waprin n=1 Tax=Python regius TaxID=51751 RepID=A0A098LY60_PYTRG
MKSRLLFLLGMILLGVLGAVPASTAEKPGSCPILSQPIPPLGVCRDTCKTDSSCKGDQKCCKNGCGNFGCTDPIF